MTDEEFDEVKENDTVYIVLDEEYRYPEDDRSIITQPIKPTLFKAKVLGKLCDYDNWGAYVHIEGSQRKHEFFQYYSLETQPVKAIWNYTRQLQMSLMHKLKEEDRTEQCGVFGGRCDHIGWCDECPRVTEDDEL